MDLAVGQAVISRTGRDKNRYMAVIRIEPDYVFVANGDLRKISNPKRKNIKHVAATKTVFGPDELESDKKLYRAIIDCFGADRR